MDHHQTLETYSGTFYRSLRRKFWRGRWMWPAAIILFLLSFAVWQWFGMRMVKIRTGNDTTHVQLPDQSGVLLNTHTTLRYHKHFKESAQREVWLSGDAAFLVQQQEAGTDHSLRPFVIHTTALDITAVSGAKLRVTAKGHVSKVAPTSGSISIHFRDKDLAGRTLQPGETLEYTGSGDPVIQKPAQ